ncbi:uncharacterized protein LOC135337854 isoform X2 [Halichondria panicea]|uniref:uncharacterized protein LOC135337854 isoform X2 n=1 Tax=Halichondria panicea TaxID=6063 RepID=UPI00312B911B
MGSVLSKAAVTDLALQWALFLVAAYFKTEKFYDLAGSATFILLSTQSLMHTGKFYPRQLIQTALVCVWAIRLGLFLFMRVMKDGHDSRFNRVRNDPKRFFIYWTVQALWIFVTLLPTLILNSKDEDRQLTTRDYCGWSVWLIGMLLESVADFQKYTFRSNPANKDVWISHGLWKYVRFPNYLGEILLWSGMFLSASSSFKSALYRTPRVAVHLEV